MQLCIESSAIKMELMCANDQSTMFMTGWTLCPQTFNKKEAMLFFHYSAWREVSSLHFDKGNECCSMEIWTPLPACSWWNIWYLYLQAPPFMVLIQDENRKGVPIAFLLFSVLTGNKATHAGYNTNILKELLSHWHNHLNHLEPSKGSFTPYVAITDSDTKEQGALLQVWPGIFLLLCRFHLCQCLTNHHKTALWLKNSDFWRDCIHNQLQALEVQ